jgi:hypothetical protein
MAGVKAVAVIDPPTDSEHEKVLRTVPSSTLQGAGVYGAGSSLIAGVVGALEAAWRECTTCGPTRGGCVPSVVTEMVLLIAQAMLHRGPDKRQQKGRRSAPATLTKNSSA